MSQRTQVARAARLGKRIGPGGPRWDVAALPRPASWPGHVSSAVHDRVPRVLPVPRRAPAAPAAAPDAADPRALPELPRVSPEAEGDVHPPGAVGAIALLLPRCDLTGTGRPSPLPALALRPLAARLTRAGRRDGLAAHVVRYRHRGWNGEAAHPVADAEWALEEVVRRYGDVPVCVIGAGLGARAALRVAGHPAVEAVVGLAPWFPGSPPAGPGAAGADDGCDGRAPRASGAGPEAADPPREAGRTSAVLAGSGEAPEGDTAAPRAPGPRDGERDAVRHLIGRKVLLVHGTNDRRAAPDASYRFAQRAKKLNPDVCRFEVHADGHGLRQYRSEVRALAVDFTLGVLFGHPLARPLQDALAAPPPLGLAMPLASGFGTFRTGRR